MEIIHLTHGSSMPNHPNMVVGIGQFDGLHRAHLSIIGKVKDIANQKHMASGIITFDPHPDYVLGKRIENTYITPLDKKIAILKEIGIDYLIIIAFTLEVASMAPDEFVSKYLDPIHIDTIVAGFDYKYGYRGSGTVESLQKHTKKEVSVCIIDEILFHDTKMGATLIRELLSKGDVVTVRDILGRYYSISGTVSPGGKVGRTLGFKTANIELSERYQELKSGVYGVIVHVKDNRYLGICNIGFNPTINTVARLRLEVHIIDFEEDIYGEEIQVEFVYRIRDELWFPNIEELIEKIHQDKEDAIIKMKGIL
jgi:riboflavin kinase / FMN adenylyltransferase